MCIVHLSTKILVTGVNVKDALSSVEVLNCSGKGYRRGRNLGRLIGRNTYEPEFMLTEAWNRS